MNNDKNKTGSREMKNFFSDAAATAASRIREFNSALNGEDSRLREKIIRSAALAGAAFLLGRASLIFRGGPLGIALLCSASGRFSALSVTAGLICRALLGKDGFLAAAVAATLGARILLRVGVDPPDRREKFSSSAFAENAYLRLSTSACAAFALEFARMAAGGFYLYDLLGAVTALIVSPLATALFFPFFPGNRKLFSDPEGQVAAAFGVASRHALMLCLCLALRDVSVLGIRPVHCAVCLCLLFTLRRHGLGEGIIAGLLCGLCAGGTYSVLYAVSALAAHSLLRVSPLAASTAITVCGAISCAITGDPAGFIGLFPSQLLGICVFTVADKFSFAKSAAKTEKNASDEKSGTDVPQEPSSDRISDVCDALCRAADVYDEFSRAGSKPTISELREVCDAACDKVCPDCPERSKCWDSEYDVTLDVIAKLCASARDHGRVADEDIPDHMKKRCGNLGAICAEAGAFASSRLRRRLDESRLDVLSSDNRTVASAISRALEEDKAENSFDAVRAGAVRAVLEDAGARCGRVSVTGRRSLKIRVSGADLSSVRAPVDELRHRLELAVGHRLSPISFVRDTSSDADGDTDGNKVAVLEMESRRRFMPVFYAARSPAGSGVEPCGDAICRISTRDGRFFAVLCDGMGTGAEAAAAADACCELFRRTLGAGICVESALEMMNALLRCSENECSVGLDLLSVDLISGEASIWKSGAAPTYVRRNGKIYPILSHTLPAGILKDVDACRTDFSVAEGDVILMTSDGVSADENALTPILRRVGAVSGSVSARSVNSGSSSANDTVRRIVRLSRDAGSADDVSVVLIVIDGEPDED